MAWVRITDGRESVMFVDHSTGECSFKLPADATSTDVTSDYWYELYDTTHKRNYYYHLGTKQTSWSKPSKPDNILPLSSLKNHPAGLSDADKEDRAKMSKIVAASTSIVAASAPTDASNATKAAPEIREEDPNLPALAENWKAVWDDNYKRFYYANLATKKTSWTRSVAEEHKMPELPPKDPEPEKEDAAEVLAKFSTRRTMQIRSDGQNSARNSRSMTSVDPIRPNISKEDAAAVTHRSNSFGSAAANPALNPANRESRPNSGRTHDPSAHVVAMEVNNPTDAPGSTVNLSEPIAETPPTLPMDLRGQIKLFGFEGYAKKYFSTYKKGVFRREVPIKELLEHSSDIPPQPLLAAMSKNKLFAKDSLTCFKYIMMYMGDKPLEKRCPNINQAAHECVEKAVMMAHLRDEMYCQVLKQVTCNPNRSSMLKGYELLTVFLATFPPTRDFTNYLSAFLQSRFSDEDEDVRTYAVYCSRKLPLICRQGARGRVPSIDEIETIKRKPFHPTPFGASLEIVMELQREKYPLLKVPAVLTTLTDAVIRLGGPKMEGIFRVPGDTEEVHSVKLALEQGNYDIKASDPHTPASVLKLWLRELDEPLVPALLYDRCVKHSGDATEMTQIVCELPDIHQKTLVYLVRFLQIITEPVNVEKTMMNIDNISMVFAPNFLRCPSDEPHIIFENTKYEQEFVKTLITHLHPEDFVDDDD